MQFARHRLCLRFRYSHALQGIDDFDKILSEIKDLLKKYEKVKIKSVLENPANRHFIRMNIITKGCVVDTEKGKVKILSRPGQEGNLNGIFV